ncbi:aminotransferase class III-fold pyridoxal phosphate-dependent enzyme [Actinopolymorpha sp. B17G11]|uniref:aminotransferase class III-fold pyridoxal phosphate-dependent enzyme n=1 Tax=Actinopolymorpha sp. B17G11 TaxID=3160861 RepID=UPI0032E4AF52
MTLRAVPGMADASDSLAWVAKAQRNHVLTSWSKQSGPDPLVVVGGEGCHFVDASGRRHLDFMSQLVNLNLGYQHPRLVDAIKQQADQLCYIGPNLANEARSRLALQLAELAPGNLTASFFTTGGAAANENAIKLARHYTGKHKIITRYRSYHGASAGAITLSGEPRRWPAEPGMPGVVRMLDPYTYRCPAGHPNPCPVCAGGPHLEEILQYEGPETVAAVLLETVTGTNGPIVPPDGYLRSIREVCDRHGILLILDEVMVGFGRLGRWFACEHWDVVPDIVSVAKGLNSGYVPLGAMIVSEPIRDWLRDHTFSGGLTYSGHPLACASGVASIEIMRDEKVVENAAAQGLLLERRLHELAARHRSIGDIRGMGLMWGIELVRNRETREPLAPFHAKGTAAAPVAQVVAAAKAKGVHFGAHDNVVRLAPPLIISAAEIDEGIQVLDDALSLADKATVP